jgi:hypothetical protein
MALASTSIFVAGRAEGMKIYLSNQSHFDVLISNTTGEAQATPGDVRMGFFQPPEEGPGRLLARGGAQLRVPSGNTVFLTLERAPQSLHASRHTLVQLGRQIGVLDYLVWLQGQETYALADFQAVDPQAEGILEEEENLFIFFGFRDSPLANGPSHSQQPQVRQNR